MRARTGRLGIAALAGVLAGTAPASAQPPPEAREAYAAGSRLLAAGDGWRASHAFERALREGYPRAPGYLALADAYLAADHRAFDARTAIERSLAADPDRLDVWLRLAELNLAIDGYDAEQRARAALREVLRRDPGHRRAYRLWSGLYMDRDDAARMAGLLGERAAAMGDLDAALKAVDVLSDAGDHAAALAAAERLAAAAPDASIRVRAAYYAAVAEAALDRPVEGWRRYRAGLAGAPTAAALEPYYRDVEPLLPEADRAAWSGWPVDRRRTFLEGWWAARDPLPFGEVNERWVEQQRRIRFARGTFQYKKPWNLERMLDLGSRGLGFPYLAIRFDGRPMDDRAELFLRHGEPEERGGPGRDECGFWYYQREDVPGDGSFAVNFERPRFGARGEFAGNDCVYSDLPTTGAGLGYFAPGGLEPWDVPRVVEATDRDLATALSTDSWPFGPEVPLPVAASPARFATRAPAGEVEIAFSFPAAGLAGPSAARTYRRGIVVWDWAWREVVRESETLPAGTAVAVAADDGPALVDRARLELPPGRYRYAVQVDDGRGPAVGAVRGEVEVRPFAAAALDASDLVLAEAVHEGGPGSRFARRGRVVVPRPDATWPTGGTPWLYYELYNLRRGADGRVRFRVDYTVRAERVDRALLRRLFGALGRVAGIRERPDGITLGFERDLPAAGVVAEHLSLETAGLPTGRYAIEVVVVDREAGGAAIARSAGFTLED